VLAQLRLEYLTGRVARQRVLAFAAPSGDAHGADHDIQPTYRIITPDRTHTAGVGATSEKVETPGIEPGSAVA
jgi:hypothetical protein